MLLIRLPLELGATEVMKQKPFGKNEAARVCKEGTALGLGAWILALLLFNFGGGDSFTHISQPLPVAT